MLAVATFAYFFNYVEEGVEKLMMDYFLENFVWKGDQTGINDLFRLIFGVGDIVVKLDDFLQQHQYVLRLHLLLLGKTDFGVISGVGVFIDVHPRLQERKLVDLEAFLEGVEEGHEDFADDWDDVVLKGVDHGPETHIPHFGVHHFHGLDERFQNVHF